MTDKSKKETIVKYSRYEKARILGSRALQISMGAPFKIKLSQEELAKLRYNPVEIAKLEYEQGLVPIEIRREVAHRTSAPKPEEKK
ncbi:MAG: DNA-directed RNA polymerase subunit K [archaeon GW2011_AR3]|nr:MAG: DNA-directed RNA polymerase subunit K [archaeon GW2011_AR3]MBS3108939.1 DNA-directed RNA polymerase subunit K [Candidatus Woesearchaeota archaeon]